MAQFGNAKRSLSMPSPVTCVLLMKIDSKFYQSRKHTVTAHNHPSDFGEWIESKLLYQPVWIAVIVDVTAKLRNLPKRSLLPPTFLHSCSNRSEHNATHRNHKQHCTYAESKVTVGEASQHEPKDRE
jgi:hypothetical protein